MTTTINDDDILDSLFHGCALTAFLQVAIEQGAMPDAESTRRRAFDLYEQSLRAKNAVSPSPGPEP
jgi:hypothetical protein